MESITGVVPDVVPNASRSASPIEVTEI